MEYTSEEILARMKADLKNEDSKIEGSFSMDNLQAVSEELARLFAMVIQPLSDEIDKKIEENITSGNPRHFEFWAKRAVNAEGKQIAGNARAYAVRDGSGLVRIAIITPEAAVPSDEDIAAVKAYIDTQRPAGSIAEVIAAQPISVNIDGKIELEEGTNIDSIKEAIQKSVNEYLTEIAFMSGETVLNYYRIGIIIGETEGVKEVIDYTINSNRESLPAGFDEFFNLKGLILSNVVLTE